MAIVAIIVQPGIVIHDHERMCQPGVSQVLWLRSVKVIERSTFLRQLYVARCVEQPKARKELRKVCRIAMAYQVTFSPRLWEELLVHAQSPHAASAARR